MTCKANEQRTTYTNSPPDSYLMEEENIYISSNLPTSFEILKKATGDNSQEKKKVVAGKQALGTHGRKVFSFNKLITSLLPV